MSTRHIATLAMLALLAGCAAHDSSRIAPAADAGWLGDVSAISAAGDNDGRKHAVQQRLDTLGIDWRTERFESKGNRGENILAELGGPSDAPLLLIGAHYDRVEVGHGATDNASGSATVLALAARFKRIPLKHHRVAIALWDLEEAGLLGSTAHVANGGAKSALYVNFDVFGWGDTLWMMTPEATHPLVAASADAARAEGLAFSAGDRYPPTDHLAFLKAGRPAVSYSLVGAGEVAGILEVFAGKTPATMPKVMQVIHRERDTLAEVDALAAERGVDAVERALRQWDASAVATQGMR
jgi:Zn-dependent M28 family amino/carboxypeptidase